MKVIYEQEVCPVKQPHHDQHNDRWNDRMAQMLIKLVCCLHGMIEVKRYALIKILTVCRRNTKPVFHNQLSLRYGRN